jgi:DNA-binding transcriptional LysR family regulator
VTLTQLSTFVLVARLGSVSAAARTLDVSEPAVSQALSALRAHFGDPLIERAGTRMRLTAAGARLLPVASQMVALGADAEAAVRTARAAPDELRVVATSTIVEFVLPPLLTAFTDRTNRGIDTSAGVAASEEMRVLVENRLADVALGSNLCGAVRGSELTREPVFRTLLAVVTAARSANPPGPPRQWSWLVDSSGTDPDSEVGLLLRRLHVAETHVRVFPNQTAAWAAAAQGAGVAPALAHLVAPRIRRGELRLLDLPGAPTDATWHITALPAERRSPATDAFLHFVRTPAATRIMREPGAGVAPSRFRPPVYVTLWS